MKRIAVVLVAAGLCAGAPRDREFTGIIYDDRCPDGLCATLCPATKAPRFTLQAGTESWRQYCSRQCLPADQKTPARYAGKRVIIKGHALPGPAGGAPGPAGGAIGPAGGANKLAVVSVSPAI